MKNIFDVLKESHEKQRLFLDALMETSGDSPTRREFYRDLKYELEQHAAAEERYFYAPLIESDKTIDMTRHGIAEHHAIDKVIAQLDDTAWSLARLAYAHENTAPQGTAPSGRGRATLFPNGRQGDVR